MHLAFNGWPMVREAEPRTALHLTDLLERLPALAPQHRYTLLLPPGDPVEVPSEVFSRIVSAGKGEWARLRFEQRRLPQEAGSRGADLLYFPYPAAPMASPVPVAAWHGFGGVARARPRGLVGRARASLGLSGLRGAAAQLSMDAEGLPEGCIDRRWAVPPMTPRAFAPGERSEDRERRVHYDLPPSYVLADEVGPNEIALLLAGWTWVDSAVGDSTSLVVLSRGRGTGSLVRSRAASLGLESSVRVVEQVLPGDLPALYRGAEAFLVAGGGGASDGVCSALACGLAIVGIESPQTSSLLGPAGYLVPAGDARRLGAACLTVLVEPAVAEGLRGEAMARGARLLSDEPLRVLLSHLERLAG